MVDRILEKHWQRVTPLTGFLLPVAAVYCCVVSVRAALYRFGVKRVWRQPVPVIVVGNMTVGGTGKTPLVAWLAGMLQRAGHKPGIIARGYGGRAGSWPQAVTPRSDPALVGDEPVLLARRTGCPVVVAPDRVAAADVLLRDYLCTVIISDDGLQHYRLGRDLEIAVIDGERRFGNEFCLPAGPLREPLARLQRVPIQIVNGQPLAGEFGMSMQSAGFSRLGSAEIVARPDEFAEKRVHALAGIGYPQRFFRQLRLLGLQPIEHVFPDHHRFRASDLAFGDDLPIVMTEKDAVKCERFAPGNAWYLHIAAVPEARVEAAILERF